jgi:hypothetical protein
MCTYSCACSRFSSFRMCNTTKLGWCSNSQWCTHKTEFILYQYCIPTATSRQEEILGIWTVSPRYPIPVPSKCEFLYTRFVRFWLKILFVDDFLHDIDIFIVFSYFKVRLFLSYSYKTIFLVNIYGRGIRGIHHKLNIYTSFTLRILNSF